MNAYKLKVIFGGIVLVTALQLKGGQEITLTPAYITAASGNHAVALQNAINDAGDGGSVFIPPQTLTLTQPVFITDKSMKIYSISSKFTKIQSSITTSGVAALDFKSSQGVSNLQWRIEGIDLSTALGNKANIIRLVDEDGVVGNTSFSAEETYIFIYGTGFTANTSTAYVVNGIRSFVCSDFYYQGPNKTETGQFFLFEGNPSGDVYVELGKCRSFVTAFTFNAVVDSLRTRSFGTVNSVRKFTYGTGVKPVTASLVNTAGQLVDAVELKASDSVRVAAGRIARIDTSTDPCYRVTDTNNVIFASNILAKNGILADGCVGIVSTANHFDLTGTTKTDDWVLTDCARFVGSSDQSEGSTTAGLNYPAIYDADAAINTSIKAVVKVDASL